MSTARSLAAPPPRSLYNGQPIAQRASSCKRQVGRKGELVALRREVTSGVGSRTGGATQISQFPVQSRHCLVRRGQGSLPKTAKSLISFCSSVLLPFLADPSLTLTRLLWAFSCPLSGAPKVLPAPLFNLLLGSISALATLINDTQFHLPLRCKDLSL